MSNQFREPVDTPVIQCQTVFRRRKLKKRIRCDDPQIALHRQLQTRTDGGSVDHADHRDRRGVQHLVQFDQPVGIVGGERVAAQVGACAEHGALPGQHDDADVLAGRLLHGLAQFLDELGVQRVAPFRTLQLNGQDVFDAGDTDHGGQPISVGRAVSNRR